MEINELFDEDSFEPEKLFDDKKYNTIIIDRDGFTKKENSVADIIESLLEQEITRQESEDLFAALKKAEAQKMLVSAIGTANGENQKKVLAAACWESGLDFSAYFIFFAELVCNSGMELAMEAFTVVQEMVNVPPVADVKKILAQIHRQSEPLNPIVPDLEAHLKNIIT